MENIKEEDNPKKIEKIKQEQVHNLLFGHELSWQAIIYDLINTEQLDPWDINISHLSQKYLEKIAELEEANYFVSSKVLLAAALLLRLKSEILLNTHIKSLDEVLFGKKPEQENKYKYERIDLDEEIPELIPKSPLPRFRKVTLQELMASLNNAIKTENRRIKRHILNKNAVRESSLSLPKKTINIKNRIRQIYAKILTYVKHKGKDNKSPIKMTFTDLAGKEKEERLMTFSPLLHLERDKKIWLEQEGHFTEIYIWLKKHFDEYIKENPEKDPFKEFREELQESIEQKKQELDNEQLHRLERIKKDLKEPVKID